MATSKGHSYKITKTKRFNAIGFEKALKNATWSNKFNYDNGADYWLRKNAKKYGFKYVSTLGGDKLIKELNSNTIEKIVNAKEK